MTPIVAADVASASTEARNDDPRVRLLRDDRAADGRSTPERRRLADGLLERPCRVREASLRRPSQMAAGLDASNLPRPRFCIQIQTTCRA